MGSALAASIGLGITLFLISPVLLPLVVVAGVPLLITSSRESRLEFDFSVRQTPAVRLRGYFTLLQTGRDEAKEVRAFGLAGWLATRFDGLYAAYLHDLRQHVLRRGLLSLVGQLGSAIVLGGTLIALVALIDRGEIGVAEAGAAIVAIRLLASQVQALFRGAQSIFESGLFLDDLSQFLALGETAVDEDEGLEPRSGSTWCGSRTSGSATPAQHRDALKGVDIELRAGEVVALVGENGSGQDHPGQAAGGPLPARRGTRAVGRAGRVRVPAVQPAAAHRRRVPGLRPLRAAGDGQHRARPDRPPAEPARVRSAAAAAGAETMLDALPLGFDTVLSRLFAGGTDLSGGQWQRVALARSFYRDAPLLILDEPSAALDPRAEHELFATLRDALRARTALFISHRFSTVRGADRIYVLHEGEIVEQGTHDELVCRDGRYAELYRLQTQLQISGEAARAVGTASTQLRGSARTIRTSRRHGIHSLRTGRDP